MKILQEVNAVSWFGIGIRAICCSKSSKKISLDWENNYKVVLIRSLWWHRLYSDPGVRRCGLLWDVECSWHLHFRDPWEIFPPKTERVSRSGCVWEENFPSCLSRWFIIYSHRFRFNLLMFFFIGWRLRKRYFLVKDKDQPKDKQVLSWVSFIFRRTHTNTKQ